MFAFSIWHLIALAIFLAIYLLPTIIAINRRSKNFIWVCVLDVVLGWSGIGWIAALIWALADPMPTSA